jgi:lipopolysaccharide transport system permease protein
LSSACTSTFKSLSPDTNDMLFGSYWQHRELILNLVKTNLKLKYRNSALGFLWSFLNPLAMSLVLIFVFMHVFKFQIANYPAYLLTGVITWRFFASTGYSLNSIRSNAHIIKKIYFPREILVFSACLFSFVVSLFEFAVLFVLLFLLGVKFSPYVLLLPLLLLILFLMVYGISLAISSLSVFYRDLEHIWEILLQVGFYAAPIIYPGDILPPEYYPILLINPMTHFVVPIRHILIFAEAPAWGSILGMFLFTSAFLLAGWLLFKRYESRFGEEL